MQSQRDLGSEFQWVGVVTEKKVLEFLCEPHYSLITSLYMSVILVELEVYCSVLMCVSVCAAGVFCAIVSHPADSVVSVLNKEKGSTAVQVLKRLGPKGLYPH